jgi:hydroxylysine kinase
MTINQPIDPAISGAAQLLTTPPPPIDEEVATAVLKDAYGLTGTVRKLIGERDQNFLVELETNERRVLKFYNNVDDAATRDFQHGALLHMERVGCECPIPLLYKTLDGAPEWALQTEAGPQHAILISFVPGIAPTLADATPRLRRNLGRTCAQLGKALASFEHPVADRILLWDHMQLVRLSGFTAAITDAKRRSWLEDFVARFGEEVEPAARTLPRQIIHNDLSASNIFVRPDDTDVVSGVIDFGDIVRAPRINEVAVAVSYFMQEGDDPIPAICDALEGYQTISPLQEAEVALIHDLVMARIALRVLIYEWRVELFPENRDYILRNSQGAWRLLDWFGARDPKAGRDAILHHWNTQGVA